VVEEVVVVEDHLVEGPARAEDLHGDGGGEVVQPEVVQPEVVHLPHHHLGAEVELEEDQFPALVIPVVSPDLLRYINLTDLARASIPPSPSPEVTSVVTAV